MGLLYSLINQTKPNWSAHVISDGSYDGFDGVNEHFSEYDNIKLFPSL